MKIKIGTILDNDIIQKLKEFAVKERKQINEVIQEALTSYLEGNLRKRALREHALARLLGKIL